MYFFLIPMIDWLQCYTRNESNHYKARVGNFAWLLKFGMCIVHPVFRFWFLVTFGDKVMKIRKYYVIFFYILQGKMGKTEKNGKKITQLKWSKYQKIKVWDERNNSPSELISSHRLWLFKMIFTILLSLTYLCTLTTLHRF